MSNLSQWSEDVKKALKQNKQMKKQSEGTKADLITTEVQLAEAVGCSKSTISSIISGRFANSTISAFSEKINKALGTSGAPERTDTSPLQWRAEVKDAMNHKNDNHGMTIKSLAEEIGTTRDKISLVINGKQWDEKVIAKIVDILGVSWPVQPSSCR